MYFGLFNMGLKLLIFFSFLSQAQAVKVDRVDNFLKLKLDILWVIDNSGSMSKIQNNLGKQFPSFLNGLESFNSLVDYQISVTTTSAYRSNPSYNQQITSSNFSLSQFVDGDGLTTSSGVRIIKNSTPDIKNVFFTNISPGIFGTADERAFNSIEETLTNPLNQGFVRKGSFLAIIIVSNEDDASWSSPLRADDETEDPKLHSVSRYDTFLRKLKGRSALGRNYMVNSIHVKDKDFDCLEEGSGYHAKFGVRYEELVRKTRGVSLSICDYIGSGSKNGEVNLSRLANHILKESHVLSQAREGFH